MTHKFGIAQPFSWMEEEKVGFQNTFWRDENHTDRVFRVCFGEMKITTVMSVFNCTLL